MRYLVFGIMIEVVREHDDWQVYYPGNEGKRRIAEDIRIPPELGESGIPGYLADLLHERATPGNDSVELIK